MDFENKRQYLYKRLETPKTKVNQPLETESRERKGGKVIESKLNELEPADYHCYSNGVPYTSRNILIKYKTNMYTGNRFYTLAAHGIAWPAIERGECVARNPFYTADLETSTLPRQETRRARADAWCSRLGW